MIAWQKQLKELGMKTAILSNMGDAVCESITRSFDWIENFDLCVWSYQLGIAKPAAEIFLHTLHQLHVAPENALFLDDKSENIAAARAVGMLALQFSSVAQLRADMLAAELNRELPLPE